MSATQRTNFFWSDWLGDQAVRRLTPAERGLWIDLLALAAAASPVGYVCDDRGRPVTLEEIARVSNAGSPDEVAKLIAGILDKGVASRDRSGRLFNRRMVRDAETAAKKAALASKRSAAGHSGGLSTSRRYFNNPALPRQVSQHLSNQLLKETLGKPIPESKVTSTFSVAARPPVDNSQSAGSLATALPEGALARQPEAEQAPSIPTDGPSLAASAPAIQGKKPAEMTRADYEALFEARRKPTPPTIDAQDDELDIPPFLRRTA